MKEYMNRETWLNQLAALMAPRFEELGHPLPPFRVSIGFTGAPKMAGAIGVCYHSKLSADGHFEIFIVPKMAKPDEVAAVLAHELTHAGVGFKCGHKGDFALVVAALGFERPFTHLKIGPELKKWVDGLLATLPPFPHAALAQDIEQTEGEPGEDGGDDDGERTSSNEKKKQTTRMLKATCQAIAPAEGGNGPGEPCGYTVRLSKKWALKLGAACPVHGGMEVEGADDAGGEEDADK